MRMVEQGVASAADIDTAMELGYGHPMGPLRLTDLVGLDVRLNIAEYLHRELRIRNSSRREFSATRCSGVSWGRRRAGDFMNGRIQR
jgi:3-hydroxyacyl-CoA dehydrogenase